VHSAEFEYTWGFSTHPIVRGGFNQMVIVEGGFCNLPSKLSPHAYKILYLKEGGKVYFSMHPLWSKCFQYARPIKFPQPTTKQINSTLNTNWSKTVFQLRVHRQNKEIANEKKYWNISEPGETFRWSRHTSKAQTTLQCPFTRAKSRGFEYYHSSLKDLLWN